jgi:hypothetical protein
MSDNILVPKYRKGKKPEKVRKPSKPIDGVNHRLTNNKAEAQTAALASIVSSVPDDDAPPTREELQAKASDLGIKFDGRTSEKKLKKLIAESLGE